MIYFDKNKNAYAFKIKDYIATCSNETWEKYADTDKWDIIDGEFVDISNTKEYRDKKTLEEKEKIAKKSITKLDFYKLILLPNGIDYLKLNEILNSNVEYRAEWDLCERVYRGNSSLIEAVKVFLPEVTEKQLDTIFMENGK